MGDGARGLAPGFQQEVVADTDEVAALATFESADVTSLLAALYERGCVAHPGLEVTAAEFGRSLARAAAAAAAGRERRAALEELAIEDFYLACACGAGAVGAAVAFETRFGKVIRRAVSRVLAAHDERDEAEQRVRQHLLVGDAGAPPAIGKYLGYGPLESWVSVVAIRVAISLGRAESGERRLRGKAIAEATGIDPERLVIREEVRRELETAVKEALAALADRERLILRLFLVSGMTLDAIGRSLDVSRQAVSRSLAKAREGLLKDVNRSLKQRLKVSQGDVASIIRFAASQLDVSISRLLSPQ
jgi:RNA polymerase sigma-70 factor, ECF subfamily